MKTRLPAAKDRTDLLEVGTTVEALDEHGINLLAEGFNRVVELDPGIFNERLGEAFDPVGAYRADPGFPLDAATTRPPGTWFLLEGSLSRS